MRLIPLLILTGWASGCAGATAEAPLTISLGIPREQTTAALHEHQYCRKEDPPEQLEIYPRCDRPGTEWGDSWVAARFDGDKLVELRRFERYADDAHAVERWNQLVADRAKVSAESPDAIVALRAKGPLERGTRTVKAFRVDPDTIVAVYLLTPSAPDNASVLEAVVHVAK